MSNYSTIHQMIIDCDTWYRAKWGRLWMPYKALWWHRWLSRAACLVSRTTKNRSGDNYDKKWSNNPSQCLQYKNIQLKNIGMKFSTDKRDRKKERRKKTKSILYLHMKLTAWAFVAHTTWHLDLSSFGGKCKYRGFIKCSITVYKF